MTAGVDTESVNTHLDEFRVAVNEIVGHLGVLGIEVNAVTCNLSPPTGRIVPVEVGIVVPQVLRVLVLATCVLHQTET